MATEITNAGYQSIRDFIESNWKYLEIRDQGSNPILASRIDVSSSTGINDQFEWKHEAFSQVLRIEGKITGEDVNQLGDTAYEIAVFTQASGGTPVHVGTSDPFVFNNTADECNIVYTFQVPEL